MTHKHVLPEKISVKKTDQDIHYLVVDWGGFRSNHLYINPLAAEKIIQVLQEYVKETKE